MCHTSRLIYILSRAELENSAGIDVWCRVYDVDQGDTRQLRLMIAVPSNKVPTGR